MTRRRPIRFMPTTEDLHRWRRLAGVVQAGEVEQAGWAGDMAAAALRARKSIVPGPLTNDSPFVQLQRQAAAYQGLAEDARRGAAETLKSLAARCLAVLDPPPPRTRADLE